VAPANPLDVVAQQVVAIAAMDEWRVDDLAALLRRACLVRELGNQHGEGSGPRGARRVRASG
jgi:Lhr-like helicase